MKEDNGRDPRQAPLLPFARYHTVHFPENRVREREESSTGMFSIKTTLQHSADIFHQGLPLLHCFPPTFHYPRHTNLFRVPALLPRAGSINAWNPSGEEGGRRAVSSSLWIYTRPSRHGQQWEFRKPCRLPPRVQTRATMIVVRGD